MAESITKEIIMTKLRFYGSTAHMSPALYPLHAPKTWKWWQAFVVTVRKSTSVHVPSTSWRWWVYFRSGAALTFDLVFDRRGANYVR